MESLKSRAGAAWRTHRRAPSYEAALDSAGASPYERLRRSALGPAVLLCVRCLLVFNLFEDGLRLCWDSAGQAELLLGVRKRPRLSQVARQAMARRRAYVPHARVALALLGLVQLLGSAGVVAARDPRRSCAGMAACLALNLFVFAFLLEPTLHVHGLRAYVCRVCGSLAGVLALLAHAHASQISARSSELEDPAAHRAARNRTARVNLAARCLLAPYFLLSGVFSQASWAAAGAGLAGAAALLTGLKFAWAAALLAVLVVTHGIGSYYEHLAGHRRHREALLFALAQDLSVFGALLLLALVGPGDLSVDARRAKRQ